MKKELKRRLGCAALCLLTTTIASRTSAQEVSPTGERRTMRAVRMADDESIVVDGKIDEPVWQRAVPATDFIQIDPHNGSPATERTDVRIAYSRTALYMAVICYDDEPDRMLRFQRRRD